MIRLTRLAVAAMVSACVITPLTALGQVRTPVLRPTVTKIPVPVIPDGAIDANIDAAVTGASRQRLRDTMKALRATDRQNVVILSADGTLIANHAALLAHAARSTPVAGSSRRFLDRRGHQFVAAGFEQTTAFIPRTTQVAFELVPRAFPDVVPSRLAASPPNASGTTGPYRRVYSNSGFSFAEGMVTIPCGSSNLKPGPQSAETGYVYTGGFSDAATRSTRACSTALLVGTTRCT